MKIFIMNSDELRGCVIETFSQFLGENDKSIPAEKILINHLLNILNVCSYPVMNSVEKHMNMK